MKVLKGILKFIGILLLIVVLTFLIIYGRIIISYNQNEDKYVGSFSIWGNQNGYVPQGLEYSSKYNLAMQTSYNANHEVSMLYVTNMTSGRLIKELKLLNEDGTQNTNHVGGVTTNDEKVWITNDYEINIYDLEEINNTENDFIKSLKTIKLPNRGDFCKFKNGILWIGDFFLKPFYPIADDNPLLLGYEVVEEIDFNEPKYIISLPKMVQGMEITEDNDFIFTESFTYLIKSKMEIYSNPLNKAAEKYSLNGKEFPYYKFDKSNLRKTIKLPPMAEGLFYKDNNLYILFENSADKYSFAYPKMENVIRFDSEHWK